MAYFHGSVVGAADTWYWGRDSHTGKRGRVRIRLLSGYIFNNKQSPPPLSFLPLSSITQMTPGHFGIGSFDVGVFLSWGQRAICHLLILHLFVAAGSSSNTAGMDQLEG